MDTVDPGTEFALWNIIETASLPNPVLRPLSSDRIDQLVPWAQARPESSLPVKLAHTCHNKSKRAVFSVCWTPEGRRLLAGTMSGEFTLYHGMNYGLEMVMQAHESAVRCARYSPAGDWLLSGDQDGTLKVWQPNFNNVKMQRAHTEVLRDVAWSPTGTKFATCSDDGSVKVWSFATMSNEHTFSGRNAHGWDVKCVDWHPSMSLMASGSKDNTMRLWDPRQPRLLATVHAFKNTVTRTRFQPTGNQNLLAAACRDHTAHVFDLRMLGAETSPDIHEDDSNGMRGGGGGGSVGMETGSAVAVLRGHPADVSCLEWHPYHPQLLATGTHSGSLHYFLLDSPSLRNDVGQVMPAWSVPYAHQWPVWDLAWHPAGHLLASGSNDKTVKVWKRADVGDPKEVLDVPAPDAAPKTPPPKKRERKPPGLP